MNIKRTLCLLLELMMAFSVVFPSAIFADDEIELYEEEYVDYAEPVEEEMIIDEVILDEEEQIVEEEIVEDVIVEEEISEDDASLIDVDDSVMAEDEQQNEEQPAATEITLAEAETFGAAPVIVTQPKDVTVGLGETASVTVEAQGENLSYTWYFKNKGASSFRKSALTTNVYSVEMEAALDGRELYCVVKNGDGKTIETNHVFMTTAIVSGDFVFEKIEGTNNLVLVEYKGTGVARIKVPNIVDGMTVTEIGAGVFEGKAELTAVELPNSITAIRERAFKNCRNLSTMTTY